MKKPPTTRIDELLVARGFASSTTKAQALVLSGVVLVKEQRVEKPSEKFTEDASIRIKGANDPAARYVGRGGVKLEGALRDFKINPTGLTCLDVGSSTGGFTDCLLQHGAKEIYAVDVGQNQLAWKLRTDARVKLFEGINVRNLAEDFFKIKFDLIVVDVSFISVTKILPVLVKLMKVTSHLLVLVKPQFETEKENIPKGGVVTDPILHTTAVSKVLKAALEIGFTSQGTVESQIKGGDGNKEFLIYFKLTES